jgi:glucose-6-phosphate 1-epimerase
MSQDAAALRQFEIPGTAVFMPGSGDLLHLAVTTPLAEARIYLHGAHPAHFQPAGGAPLIFVSEHSHFSPGKAIRGGVPIIFPWFGPHPTNASLPAHGFARTMPWQVESLALDGNQTVIAVFRLDSNEQTRALWPHDFVLRHRVVVGKQLVMTLEVENTSDAPFKFEEALHTYFAVGDIRKVSTTGLENCAYIDKTDGLQRKTQGPEPIRITSETDRVFENTRAAVVIDDAPNGRKIHVEKGGSATTVIWNPWETKAASMTDFGREEWRRMLCVETANASANAITLKPGARHAMRAAITPG